jgi:hypothetical protein
VLRLRLVSKMRALVDMAKLRLVLPFRRIVGAFYAASAPEPNKLLYG